jgi:hypothetical protein
VTSLAHDPADLASRRPVGREAGRWLVARLQREGLPIAVLCLFALVIFQTLPGAIGADSWLALVGGREVAHGGIPHADTLTAWAAGREWIDQQWLAQLVSYGLFVLGGFSLVLLAHALLTIGATALAVAAARKAGASARGVSVIFAGCIFPLLLGTWQFRTETYAHLLFVLLAALLVLDSRRPSRRVWLAIPLLVVWANFHGSVVLGVALTMLWGAQLIASQTPHRSGFVRRPWSRGLPLVVGAPLCLLASPYGVSALSYYSRVLLDSRFGALVVEWQPPHLSPLTAGFYVLAGVGVWLVAAERSALTRFEKLAFWLTLVAAMLSIRNIVWFALLALIVLPQAASAALEKRSAAAERPALNAVLASILLALVGGTLLVTVNRPSQRYTRDYPRAAAGAVMAATARDQSLRVFAEERFADWLLWEEPELRGRLAYDVRFELLRDDELKGLYRWHEQMTDGWRAASRCCRLLVVRTGESPDNEAAYVASGARPLFRREGVAVLLRPKRD